MCVVHLICSGGRRLGGTRPNSPGLDFCFGDQDQTSYPSPRISPVAESEARWHCVPSQSPRSRPAPTKQKAVFLRLKRERERVSERVFACGVLFQPSTLSSAVLQPAVCSVQSCSSEGGSQLSGKVQVCFCNSKSLFGGVGPNCPGPRLKSRSPAPAGLGVSSHRRFLLGGPVAETV